MRFMIDNREMNEEELQKKIDRLSEEYVDFILSYDYTYDKEDRYRRKSLVQVDLWCIQDCYEEAYRKGLEDGIAYLKENKHEEKI